MPEVWPEQLSKEAQAARSPGKQNRPCPTTGEPRRSCSCYSCRGRRNQRKGKRTQREVRKGFEKVFQVPAGPSVSSTADEENWRLPLRIEVKSGAQAKPVYTFYRNTKAQSDAKKAIGDPRDFAAAARADGDTDPLVVIRLSHLIQAFEEARR